MPIYSVGDEGNKEVVFGSGDIKISSGWSEEDESIGVLTLHEGEVEAIGHSVDHNPHLKSDYGQRPVRLVFYKTESVDVLINQLKKVKDYMAR